MGILNELSQKWHWARYQAQQARRGPRTISVAVKVNGREFHFLLDTGATNSSLQKKYADELGLKRLGQVTILTGGGEITTSVVHADSFEVGGVILRDCYLHVQLFEDDHADGIIGTDLLAHFIVHIDVKERKVILRKR